MRPMPKMTMAEAVKTAAKRHGRDTYICKKCQYWVPNYCGILAAHRPPQTMACHYGRIKIRSDVQHGTGKRGGAR